MELKIYDKQGLVKMTVSPDNSSQWNHEVEVENVVTVNFTTWEFLVLEVGWYILVEGHRFSIKSEYRPKQIHDTKYTYNLKFYGREHDTQDILFCRLNQGENDLESVFAYDGTPMDFLQKVVANMNRNTDGVEWKSGEAISANRQTINFNGLYCWDALGEIARAFGTEWWMDGEYLNLSKCVRGESVSLGYGEGLKSGLTQNENTNAVKWFTRLIPVGSSKNIDKSTYGYANLQLPGREKYIDINTQYGLKEYREEAAFSEIYPHRVGAISSVRSEERTNEETGNFTVYYVKDSSLPFNPDEYMIGGEVIHMTFNSGALAGKDFEVNWSNETKEFEIINQYPDENTQLPGNYLIPAIGDAYVLSNISMPDEYNTAAEKEYKEAVDAYLAEYSKDVSVYSGNSDYIYVAKNNVPLLLGQRVLLKSEQYFDEGSRESRIIRVSRKLNNLGEASIDCSDAIASSWKSSVDSSLNQLLFAAAQVGAQSVFSILKTGDTDAPSEYNVFSAKRSLNTFLSKIKDDTAAGLITFLKGIISKGQTETDDVIVNQSIHSKEFISGFLGGKGWAIRLKEYLNATGVTEERAVAEFDDLIVRGTMRVFEFVVSQLLGENDNRVFTAMLEVDHYDPVTGKVWLDTQDGTFYNPFRKDDIILVQQFNGLPSKENGYYITKQYELIIDEVGVGDLSLKEERLDWVTFRNFSSPMEGSTVDLITKGDTFVRIDNLTDPNRKGIIQMMTVGEDTPYMDVIYGRKTDPDNALKSRFGNLQGIYNHMFGWLKDFGAYIANLYAVGEFRIAHSGEDVSDKIEMVKGAFRTNFSQSYFDMKDDGNYLSNGTFSGNLEGWELGESGTDFLTIDGLAIYANRNVMTANNNFVGKSVYNDKDMLRIFNSDIEQPNSIIKKFGTHKEYKSMDGSEENPSYEYANVSDKAYFFMRFFCDGDGTVEIGFDNDDTSDDALPFIVMDVEKRTEEYLVEAEGVWNNKGNFVIRSTADIYIEFVTLTDRPLENFMSTTETWMEQDAGRIALLGRNISKVDGAVTDLGIEVDATNEQLRLYVEKTDGLESNYSQLRIDVDGISSTVTEVEGDITDAKELAQSAEDAANAAAEEANEAWWDAYYAQKAANKAQSAADNAQSAADDAQSTADTAYSKAVSNASTIQQHAEYISLWAGSFDEDGNVLTSSGAIIDSEFTKIYSRVDDVEASISTFVTYDEMNKAISNIVLTADNVDINGIVQVEGSNAVTIGGFTVYSNRLQNSEYTPDGSPAYISLYSQDMSSVAYIGAPNYSMGYFRNDKGTALSLYTQGTGVGLEILAQQSSKAIISTGSSVLVGRKSGNEMITIAGLALSCKNGNDFTSPSNPAISNTSAWVDFLVMTGNTSLPDPTSCPGKLLFIKMNSSYTLTVYNCIKAGQTNSGTATWDNDNDMRGFISVGTSSRANWYELYLT